MRISLNWLNEFVNIKNENKKELAEKITRAGVSVEAISKLCSGTNLTIGQVIERKDHPKSDHLNVCKVDLGKETVTIVCGANNVSDGIKVIVAKDGAILPGDVVIKKTTIRDIESNGMICSLPELGLPSIDDNKDGIHILDDAAVVGEDPLTHLGFDDVVYCLDLNPNRNDCLSIIGMAYETAAVLKTNVILPTINILESTLKTSDYIKVESNTDNCKLYTTRLVKDVVIKESPDFIKSRLIASGIRPINNVVDISNYVMLEYGQPLHFFDYDKIGNNIVVRMAKDNEETITLDHQQRTLSKEDIVITNGKDIIAIAGVMGCHNSDISDHSKNILIESAIFDPYSVRRTSITDNLRSEASFRFEKGLDPNKTLEALNRAAYLLQTYASGTPTKDIVSYDKYNKEEKTISITLQKINDVLGMTLTDENIIDVFERLQFKLIKTNDEFIVTVPTRRLDISIKEDLIEEVGRLYGYDNIIAKLPIGETKRGKYTKKTKYRKQISKHLQSLGLNQVRTYSLTGDEEIDMFNNDNFEKITLASPMSEDKKNMRHSLLPALINVINYNLARSIKDMMIYETSTIYYQKDNEFIEEELVSGALLGSYLATTWRAKKIDIDFYLTKGILENLFDYIGLSGRYVFEKDNKIPKEFHPGRSAVIKIDNQTVGYIGVIHPNLHKLPIVLFELSITKLLSLKVREIKYKDIPKYPSIIRDFAIVVDKDIKAFDMTRTIKRVGGRILTNVELFDLYTGDNVELGKKSLAFNLIFQDPNRTLVEEEITDIFNKIIYEAEKTYNGIARTK